MAVAMTTNDIIKSAKSRSLIPSNQSTFQTQDFINFMNEEMLNAVVPRVLQVHEDFYMIQEDIALIPGKSNYRIPYRSIGNRLRDVAFKDINGNVFEMTRVSVGDISFYQGSFTVNQFRTFYVKSDEIVIVPSVGQFISGSLEFTYYIRPNKMVTEDRAAKIVSINYALGEVTVDRVPSNFSTNIKMDFIQSKSPYKIISFDVTPTSVNSVTNVITFDPVSVTFDPRALQNPEQFPQYTDLSPGDYVMQAEETIIPQIPAELHSILAHRVALRCLEAMGDAQGLQLANSKLAEMEQNLYELIDNRVEEAPQKVTNRHSTLRQVTYSKKYRRRGI